MVPTYGSYVYGHDNKSGWEDRYFFTFYSQFDSGAGSIFEVIILTVIFIISSVSSIILLWCILRYKEMQNPTNYFVLNLILADMLFICAIPFMVYTRVTQHWLLGSFACKFLPFAQAVSIGVLLWVKALLSMEQYVCVVIPPYESKLTNRKVILYSLITWSIIALLFSPVAMYFQDISVNDLEETYQICTLFFPNIKGVSIALFVTILIVLVFAILPLALLCNNYQQISKKLVVVSFKSCNIADGKSNGESHTNKVVKRLPLWTNIFVPLSKLKLDPKPKPSEENRLKQRMQIVRLILGQIVLSVLLWVPLVTCIVLIYIDGKQAKRNKYDPDPEFKITSDFFVGCLIVAYINTLFHPFFYGILSKKFRSRIRISWLKFKVTIGFGTYDPTQDMQNDIEQSNTSYNVSTK